MKKGTQGEERDAARVALYNAEGQVEAARGALRRHWVCATSVQLEAEAQSVRKSYRSSREQARCALESARRGGHHYSEDFVLGETNGLEEEESRDMRRALRSMEADRRTLRVLEMRADDPTFTEREACKVADIEPLPLQTKPWVDVSSLGDGIPKLGSMVGPQPNLLDYNTIKKVAQFRCGGRAVLDQGEAGPVAVRIEDVQLAHPDVPPYPTNASTEAAYLVRNDSTATTYARTAKAKWVTGERLKELQAGVSIRPNRWVGRFSRPYESFDAIRNEAQVKADALALQAQMEDLAARRAQVETKLRQGQTKADVAEEIIARRSELQPHVPTRPQSARTARPSSVADATRTSRPFSATPTVLHGSGEVLRQQRRPTSAHPSSRGTSTSQPNSAATASPHADERVPPYKAAARPAKSRPMSARAGGTLGLRSSGCNTTDSEAMLELLAQRRKRASISGLRELSDRFAPGHHLSSMPRWVYVKGF